MGRGVLFAVAAALCAFVVGAPTAFAGGLRTGIVDPAAFRQGSAAFDQVVATGATTVKIQLLWHIAAPTKPPNPEDPADVAYSKSYFAAIDAQVRLAVERDLAPIIYVQSAPEWAEGVGAGAAGTVKPNAVEFGKFARAVATRYSGAFPAGCATDPAVACLPRVRYWQAWNEPNRNYFLMPQYANGRMVSPALYRALLRRFAEGVTAAAPDNLVVAGGLAPLGRKGKPPPLGFMRKLLCMSPPPHKRTCDLRTNPVPVDVWAHHPYTSGGPTHQAPGRDDVSLGDLPEMRRLLTAAAAAGQLTTRRPDFWVTEFSWDSNPPDPKALGSKLHGRWVAEAMYRMWKNGVTLVTWFRLQDDPLTGPGSTPYQSGWYRVDGAAAGSEKKSFQAFRFPFVAFRKTNGIYVWGRTPSGSAGTVTIERTSASGWRKMGVLTANANGVVQKTFRTTVMKGSIRGTFEPIDASAAPEKSLAFSLATVRDRYVNPFGCGGTIRC